MLPPAQVLSVPTTTTDLQLLTGTFLLRGWSFGETTGAAVARAVLYDGIDATTPVVGVIGVGSSGSSSLTIPGSGVLLRTGLFLDVTAGSLIGSVFVIPVTDSGDLVLVHGEWGPMFYIPTA